MPLPLRSRRTSASTGRHAPFPEFVPPPAVRVPENLVWPTEAPEAAPEDVPPRESPVDWDAVFEEEERRRTENIRWLAESEAENRARWEALQRQRQAAGEDQIAQSAMLRPWRAEVPGREAAAGEEAPSAPTPGNSGGAGQVQEGNSPPRAGLSPNEGVGGAMEAAVASGAIPRRLDPSRGVAIIPPTPAAMSHDGESREERESREAEEELARILGGDNEAPLPRPLASSGSLQSLVEGIAAGGRTRILRDAPEGNEAPPEWVEPRLATPDYLRLPVLPIEPQPWTGPLAWDLGQEEDEVWGEPMEQSRRASAEPPTAPIMVVVGPTEVPADELAPQRRSRNARRRRPQNPRRQWQLDDYESAVETRRSATPPPPTYESVVRDGEDRARPPTARTHPVPRATGYAPRPTPRVVVRGNMFGELDPVPFNPMVDPSPDTCFNCWQEGHIRSKCPRPVEGVYCFNCGRRDENLKTCPRCKGPHERYLERLRASQERRRSAQGEEEHHRTTVPSWSRRTDTASSRTETRSSGSVFSRLGARAESREAMEQDGTGDEGRADPPRAPAEREEQPAPPRVEERGTPPSPPEVVPLQDVLQLVQGLRDLPEETRVAVFRAVFPGTPPSQ